MTHAQRLPMPTIVGECEPLPDGEWEFFTTEVANSGLLDVQGNLDYIAAGFHQPTWCLEIETANMTKRLKSYGARAMTTLSADDEAHAQVWTVSLAISAVELLAARLPWSERLEFLPRDSKMNQLDDLLSIE
jgi:hypothetical protein